jgi:hypothetical protein
MLSLVINPYAYSTSVIIPICIFYLCNAVNIVLQTYNAQSSSDAMLYVHDVFAF